jgi:hypothetical protein
MKIISLFPLLFCTYFISFSQTGCLDAQAHIIYAFNNAKDGLESNNITDVKYYAQKTLESFKNVQSVLGDCDCENVENLTYESIQKLSKVTRTEKMSDAKYFVAKSKDNSQKIITALDYCTVTNKGTSTVTDKGISPVIDDKLSYLEKEQLKLKQQQKELLKQQEALNQKMLKQKEADLSIEKQQLITISNAALIKNIKAYNEVLHVCHCGTSIPDNYIEISGDQLMTKSIDEIRTYYIASSKNLTSSYLELLNNCDSKQEDKFLFRSK